MVAATHVEQRLLLKALLGSGLITEEVVASLESADIAREVRELSPHAVSTEVWRKMTGVQDDWFRPRTTTTAPAKILLPLRYVTAVLDAFKGQIISSGKAARMLMINEYEFAERFAPEQPAYAD
jgi:hypothetical protein